MENSSFSNTTVNLVVQLPPILDYSFRVVFLVIHAIYFVIVAIFPSLQKMSLIHVHHTNLIGLLNGIHYCIWISWNQPNTGNPAVDSFLCTFAETFWALSKFARCFSILVLAVYRVIAVYRVHLFKRIADSKVISFITMSLVWIVSAVIFIVSKFVAGTVPGLIYCYDGYSPSMEVSIIYYVITSVLGYLMPVSLIIVAYVFIQIKLNSVGSKLHKGNGKTSSKVAPSVASNTQITSTSENSIGTSTSVINQTMSQSLRNRERSLARQFIIINCFEIGSCIFFVFLSSSNVILIFNTKYYFVRQVSRILNLICQTAIPIVSLIYMPLFKKFLTILGF